MSLDQIIQINYHQAEFYKSASRLNQCPEDTGAEVAFAGRSNAGKSSAVNALTANKKLARTSKTPGRTQLLNFFTLPAENCRLVDLPGYGYAKVPLAMKQNWQKHLDNYLQKRQCLKGVVLVMDIRHPMKEFDCTMTEWCQIAQMPIHVLLTKADKLKRGAAQSSMLKLQNQLNSTLGDLASVQTFSALKNQGIEQLRQRLDSWLTLTAESETD